MYVVSLVARCVGLYSLRNLIYVYCTSVHSLILLLSRLFLFICFRQGGISSFSIPMPIPRVDCYCQILFLGAIFFLPCILLRMCVLMSRIGFFFLFFCMRLNVQLLAFVYERIVKANSGVVPRLSIAYGACVKYSCTTSCILCFFFSSAVLYFFVCTTLLNRVARVNLYVSFFLAIASFDGFVLIAHRDVGKWDEDR